MKAALTCPTYKNRKWNLERSFIYPNFHEGIPVNVNKVYNTQERLDKGVQFDCYFQPYTLLFSTTLQYLPNLHSMTRKEFISSSLGFRVQKVSRRQLLRNNQYLKRNHLFFQKNKGKDNSSRTSREFNSSPLKS